MHFRLGCLGLICLAITSFAVAAPAAGASVQHTFNSHTAPTVLTGFSTENIFRITPGIKASCVVTLAGTMKTKTASEMTFHPTISGCVFQGSGEKISATVDTVGCNLRITGLTDEVAPGESYATTSIECSAGNALKVTMPFCTASFLTQTATEGSRYSNEKFNVETWEWDLRMIFLLRGLSYTSSGWLCGIYGIPASSKGAAFDGIGTIKGWEDEGGPTNEDEYIDGKQTGIWYTTD